MLNAGLRKGTKSCTECRRRKVRCVRLTEDAVSCRQCEDRGVSCNVQISSTPRSSRTPRFSSRHRITQLEGQVSQLTRVVNDIESKLGYKPSHIPRGQAGQSTGPDDSDEESSGSDIPMAENASHLRSLFQNDWLSVETGRHEQHTQQRLDKASKQISMIARPRLQSTIPSKDEVSEIAKSAYDWLAALHGLFPQPSIVKSPQGLLDSYDSMCWPDADVIALASWLVTLALTAQQLPRESDHPDVRLRKCLNRSELCRKITNTVEHTILCHDRLLGSIQGLDMGVHFVRLQIGQGNFQKAWIKVRHIIAIAELMGLPKVFQAVRLNRTGHIDEHSHHRAQLWEVICNMDRLLGILINLPPGTGKYQLTNASLIVNGVVQPHIYLTKLLGITVKLHDLEELNATQESNMKMHLAVLEIAEALGELASQAPTAWWAENEQKQIAAEDLVQFMHYCVLMRVYLPLALQRNRGDELAHARLPCMNACESVARRYLSLRQRLPAGLFMSRMLDLQALTAAAVLLLLSPRILSADPHNFSVDRRHLHGLIGEVIELLGERSKDPTNSQFASEAFSTLRALKQLLQQDDHAAKVQTLTLTVPLLGKIHVRRNIRSLQAGRVNNHLSSQPLPNFRAQEGNMVPQPLPTKPVLNTATSMNEPVPTLEDWRWDDLSWSIENNFENMFESTLLAENLEYPMAWQGNSF